MLVISVDSWTGVQMNRIMLATGLLTSTVMLCSCGTQVYRTGEASAVVANHSAASSPEWSSFGEVLKRNKAAQVEQGHAFANSGAWAFQSDALDLNADGNYTFVFKVGKAFPTADGGVSPFGISFPQDTDFHVSQAEPPQLFSPGTDEATLRVTIRVQGLSTPYPAYTIWVS